MLRSWGVQGGHGPPHRSGSRWGRAAEPQHNMLCGSGAIWGGWGVLTTVPSPRHSAHSEHQWGSPATGTAVGAARTPRSQLSPVPPVNPFPPHAEPDGAPRGWPRCTDYCSEATPSHTSLCWQLGKPQTCSLKSFFFFISRTFSVCYVPVGPYGGSSSQRPAPTNRPMRELTARDRRQQRLLPQAGKALRKHSLAILTKAPQHYYTPCPRSQCQGGARPRDKHPGSSGELCEAAVPRDGCPSPSHPPETEGAKK